MDKTSAENGIALFTELTTPMIEARQVGGSSSIPGMFSIQRAEKIAWVHPDDGDLIVYLPRKRVDELITDGVGKPPSRGPGRGWKRLGLQVHGRDPSVWRGLLEEARVWESTDLDSFQKWRLQVEGSRDWDHSAFAGLINGLPPDRYDEAFGDLPRSAGFIKRLRRLAAPELEPGHWQAHFVPFVRDAVDDRELLSLAERVVSAKLQVIEESEYSRDWWEGATSDYATLEYVRATERPKDYYTFDSGLSEAFQNCDRWDPGIFSSPNLGNWSSALGEACYTIAASYDLKAWLWQEWMRTSVDLEPLFEFWKAGGQLSILQSGQAVVTTAFIDG